MFRLIAIICHALLVAWFVYLQAHGASILGSDEETHSSSSSGHSGGSHSSYHK